MYSDVSYLRFVYLFTLYIARIQQPSVTFNNQGLLQWNVDSVDIQTIKNVQPKLKLQLCVQASEDMDVTILGYVLLDIRDFVRDIKPHWYRIHGMINTEIQVSAKLLTLSRFRSQQIFQTHARNIKQPLIEIAMPTNISSTTYSFCLVLEDFKFLTSLTSTSHSQFWFSWSVFDQTFQSEEFSSSDAGPQRVRDTLPLQISGATPSAIYDSIGKAFPIRFFLCTQDNIVGAAELTMASFVASANIDSPANLQLPIYVSHWLPVVSTSAPFSSDIEKACSNDSESASQTPSIQVGIEIATSSVGRSNSDKGDGEADADVDEYADDDFDCENEEGDGESKSFQNPEARSKTVKGKKLVDNAAVDESDHQLRHFRVSMEVRNVVGLRRPAHLLLSFSYPHLGSTSSVRTHPVWAPAHADVKIDGGAASYDCCMSRAQFRDVTASHPLVVSAMSRSHLGTHTLGVVNVDLSAPYCTQRPHSFRCAVTGRTFQTREEYTQHRHTLLALASAGRLGSVPPAEPVAIYAMDTFLSIVASASATAPATEYAASVEGAKMRVVVIVEDLCAVGSEIAVPVRPGYKQHGAGVYGDTPIGGALVAGVNFDGDYRAVAGRVEPSSASGGNTGNVLSSQSINGGGGGVSGGGGGGGGSSDGDPGSNPADRIDLTAAERARLEELTADWREWQRMAEAEWRESLRLKEQQLKTRLEESSAAALAQRADDLRRAYEEAGRLEIRLRESIESAEKQRAQLAAKEEQITLRLAQKTAELQLLQRRVRDEARYEHIYIYHVLSSFFFVLKCSLAFSIPQTSLIVSICTICCLFSHVLPFLLFT